MPMMMIVKQANKAVDPSASTRGYIGVVESHEGLGRSLESSRDGSLGPTRQDANRVSRLMDHQLPLPVGYSHFSLDGTLFGISKNAFVKWSRSFVIYLWTKFPIVRSKLMDWEPQKLRWMALPCIRADTVSVAALLPAIPHSIFLLLPTLSSAVTPSHSARHPSDTCQSVHSSGRPLDRSPTAASASGPLRTPLQLLCSPSAVYANPSPQSALNPKVRQCPDSPQQAFWNLAHSAYFYPLSRALES
ncbi:hypothetical protein PGT21_002282 [Puccinia graminis f. sp. tritici]|uniref:Uncharacterized protein n=1 Tax=Puccinia graminis f. sp. tritici TaxID=56615 RepID=A0A5B0MVF2_PUCGR|nr:hypothetical protein PGT21_002282 [Puccinia graminis f. sp. tritici]